jgi:hypothetical protein
MEVTTIDLINKFCYTHDIEIFKKLPESIKDIFYKLSMIISKGKNIGNSGLAYLILNNITPTTYIRPNFIYGIYELEVLESEKYNMKILSLGDSHTLKYRCPSNVNAMSVVNFIKQEIIHSDSYIDLFVELPYLSKSNKTGIELGETYMQIIRDDFEDCFTWTKDLCIYPHLRAHYIDLRHTIGNHKFLLFGTVITNLYYSGYSNIDLKILSNSDVLADIFNTKQTLISYMTNLIKQSKIQKQIDNIQDTYLRNNIEKQIEKWLLYPNEEKNYASYSYIKWRYLEWSYIKEGLTTKNKGMIENIWNNFVRYIAVIMDAYALARIFRDYRSINNKNSNKAKYVILFNGGFHNKRYISFMKEQGFISKGYNYCTGANACISLDENIKLPVFSTHIKDRKICPPCNRDQICNEKTRRCVLRTGKIGMKILENQQ